MLSRLLPLLVLLVVFSSGVAQAQQVTPDDVRAALREAAAQEGVSGDILVQIVACETGQRFNADALGDRGTSHGIAQLNDRPTGLLSHFYSVGYSNPYSVEQASAYLARVAAGHWSVQGITLRRWSCYR